MRTLADSVLGWEGGMRPVIKFFNTGRICTKQVTSLESWILSEGRPAMGVFTFHWIYILFSEIFLFSINTE
jgi:hypothetical protein